MRLSLAAKSTAVVAATALLITARDAGAQQWWQLCAGAPGESSCTALQVQMTAVGPASTRLAVRAQNLQGTFAGSTGASVLEQIYLHFGSPIPSLLGVTDAPTPGPGVVAYNGTGNLVGATPGPWTVQTSGVTVSMLADNPTLGYFTDVRGCSGPSPLEDPGYVTCGDRGTSWVEFAFNIGAALGESDLQSVGFGTRYGAFGLNEHVCNDVPSPNVACRVERFTPSVVPEPSSVALVAVGLGGLAATIYRRRSA